MLFLCRAGRLSAAALDQALQSPGSLLVRVRANGLGDVTLTSGRGHTYLRCRSYRVSARGAESPLRHLAGKLRPQPLLVRGDRQSTSGFVTADWGHARRAATVAADLCERVRVEGGDSDAIGPPPLARSQRRRGCWGEPAGDALFTGSWGVFAGTMQTRASSTHSAAKKRSAAGEEQTAGGDKGDELNLKEPTLSASSEKAPGELEPQEEKPSKTQQLKKVFKEYGAVGVSFHIGISLMSLGMFYLLISSGIDMAAVLCKLGFSETVVRSKMAAGTSTFVLAYAIHKLFAPVRISITLVSVPLIVRHFRKTGLFKPPTPTP